LTPLILRLSKFVNDSYSAIRLRVQRHKVMPFGFWSDETPPTFFVAFIRKGEKGSSHPSLGGKLTIIMMRKRRKKSPSGLLGSGRLLHATSANSMGKSFRRSASFDAILLATPTGCVDSLSDVYDGAFALLSLPKLLRKPRRNQKLSHH